MHSRAFCNTEMASPHTHAAGAGKACLLHELDRARVGVALHPVAMTRAERQTEHPQHATRKVGDHLERPTAQYFHCGRAHFVAMVEDQVPAAL